MQVLRSGVTTGICAAAAAKGAAIAMFTAQQPDTVVIVAKNGVSIEFEIVGTIFTDDGGVICSVIKDAGDDPDITNGVKVYAAVSRAADIKGVEIDGGEGIGRVTKPGLKVSVGKAAINPVPLEMIETAINDVKQQFSHDGGIKVVISIPGGEELAKKTMNERLGIIGGLSILGTTGIVEPMSEKALIDTIKADIDVQVASGLVELLVTPGNYGRDFASDELGLDINDAIKCSNYIGDMLDYACTKEIEKILLIGHAGKLVKLAAGIMNTHSAIADGRLEIIAAHSALVGADASVIREIMECVSVQAAVEILNRLGIGSAVWESIGNKIAYHLQNRIKGSIAVRYIVFTQENGILCEGETK